jgi:hypothetical protein
MGNAVANVAQRHGFPIIGVELLLSAILMFVIISVATATRAVGQWAALAIGATVSPERSVVVLLVAEG